MEHLFLSRRNDYERLDPIVPRLYVIQELRCNNKPLNGSNERNPRLQSGLANAFEY